MSPPHLAHPSPPHLIHIRFQEVNYLAEFSQIGMIHRCNDSRVGFGRSDHFEYFHMLGRSRWRFTIVGGGCAVDW